MSKIVGGMPPVLPTLTRTLSVCLKGCHLIGKQTVISVYPPFIGAATVCLPIFIWTCGNLLINNESFVLKSEYLNIGKLRNYFKRP